MGEREIRLSMRLEGPLAEKWRRLREYFGTEDDSEVAAKLVEWAARKYGVEGGGQA